MLELKKAGMGDLYAEYCLFKAIPEEESGFMNEYHDISYEQYQNEVLKEIKERDLGINLKEGYVPDSKYLLWLDDKAIAIYNFRHYLNDFLKNGPGHIGYTVLKEYRGKGYGSQGLQLLIEEVKDNLKEDELYMSSNLDNEASLRLQMKCGAYLHHRDDKYNYTRIKIR